MKTVMVIGASGFIGSNLVHYLRKKYRVIPAFSRNVVRFPGLPHCNYSLADRDYMKRMMLLLKPDAIVYCAGVNDLLECHTHTKVSEAVNSFGPVVVSQAADTIPHRFVYISSALTYDGVKGNFFETDQVMPHTTFGKQKLAGENYVRSKFLNYGVIRFSPIYGVGNYIHPSDFDKIRMKLERGQKVELASGEVHSFLALSVALKAIEWVALVDNRNRTYNLGGSTKISWYEFGCLVAESLGFDRNLVIPSRGNFEDPVDFSLNGTDLVRALEVDPLVLEQGLDLLKQQLIR